MNFGRIDMGLVRDLARSAGINDAELDAALAAQRLNNLSFTSGA